MTGEPLRACTLLIPHAGGDLGLENARLLLLTDFLCRKGRGRESVIALLSQAESWLEGARSLGLSVQAASDTQVYDVAVVPRDYGQTFGMTFKARESFSCGRLLETEDYTLSELIDDFGIDALRMYFLYMGPPARDYRFRWQGLVSSYRFVERLWRLAQHPAGDLERSGLLDLHAQVQARLAQGKPHTALAAVMGYVKLKEMLAVREIEAIAILLQPYAPHLSAELLELMAAIQNDDGR